MIGRQARRQGRSHTRSGGQAAREHLGAGINGSAVKRRQMTSAHRQQEASPAEILALQRIGGVQLNHMPPLLAGPVQAQQGLRTGGTGRSQIRTHLRGKRVRCIDHPSIGHAVLQHSPNRVLALQRSDVQTVKLETVVSAGGGRGHHTGFNGPTQLQQSCRQTGTFTGSRQEPDPTVAIPATLHQDVSR